MPTVGLYHLLSASNPEKMVVCFNSDTNSKIVIRLPREEAGNKAMQIAAGIKGVTKLEISAKDKDRVIVIGEGINPVELTPKLMKKIGKATSLISVEQLKKPDRPEDNKCKAIIGHPVVDNYQPYYCPPRVAIYDPYGTDNCSIL